MVCFINCLSTYSYRSDPQMTSNPAAFLLIQDKVGYKYDNVVKHMVKIFFWISSDNCSCCTWGTVEGISLQGEKLQLCVAERPINFPSMC